MGATKSSDAAKKEQLAMAALNLDEARYGTDELITYKEFMSALRGQDSLYKRILPRTLSFVEILTSIPEESRYEISDM